MAIVSQCVSSTIRCSKISQSKAPCTELLARGDCACSVATRQFQGVAYDQVVERHFTKIPSRWRMVQLYASKQAPIVGCIPQEWAPTTKTFCVRALRKAAKMACHKPTRVNKSTKHKETASSKLSHHNPMNPFASPDDGSMSPCNATSDDPDDLDDPIRAGVKAWVTDTLATNQALRLIPTVLQCSEVL